MTDLPLPLPDRRITQKDSLKKTSSTSEVEDINKFKNKYENSKYNSITNDNNESNEDLRESTHSNIKAMSLIKLKQIDDMRSKILNYKLLTEKTMFINSTKTANFIDKSNIILFGPSGSGKSSFIKSLYRSLYNSQILPPEVMNKLIIRGNYRNEGTLNFTKLYLVVKTNNNTGITLCDTRGHFKMNQYEKEQFKIILEGNVKDGVKIEQKKERDPLSLWEFWKRDSELFPKEIFDAKEPGINSVPHAVVFVFDGSIDNVIQEEDIFFYKDLVNFSKNKGYQDIHVVLTRIDLFEKMVNKRYKNLPKSERNIKLNLLKDEKIEKVIETLNVNRSNIHFLENYHGDGDSDNQQENNLEIDYHILKALVDILNSSESYMLYYMNQKQTCFAGCFN
jgi:predicted AAA+ superfamily ATPase